MDSRNKKYHKKKKLLRVIKNHTPIYKSVKVSNGHWVAELIKKND